MMRKRKVNFITFAMAGFIFLFSPGGILAEIKGEIINISKEHKVAFTDIGKENLSLGDIVKVLVNEGKSVYLEVMESSLGLSKLGFVSTQQYITDPKGFEEIIVGNTVIKVTPAVNNGAPQPKISPEGQGLLETQLQEKEKTNIELQKQIQDLDNVNRALKQEIGQMSLEKHVFETEKAQQLKEIDALKNVIRELKIKLESMNKAVQGILAADP